MTRRVRTTSMAILVVLVALVPSTGSAQSETRFRLSGTLPGTVVPDAACQGFHITHIGTLDGAPLGTTSWSSTECADLVVQPGGITIRDGVFSLNNGLLTGTYSARGGFPDASGHVYVWGPFSITGGTGAYEGARGGGVITAVADVMTGAAELDLSGDLTV